MNLGVKNGNKNGNDNTGFTNGNANGNGNIGKLNGNKNGNGNDGNLNGNLNGNGKAYVNPDSNLKCLLDLTRFNRDSIAQC